MIPENIPFSKRVGLDFDSYDLIPKDQKQVSFAVQNNQIILLIFYISLKIPSKSEKEKKIKTKFPSLFKKLIVYFDFLFFFFAFYSTCTKHGYQKKKKKKQAKNRRIGVIDSRNHSIPEPSGKDFDPSPLPFLPCCHNIRLCNWR